MSRSSAKAKMRGKHLIAGLLLLLASACDTGQQSVKPVEPSCTMNGLGALNCNFKNPGSSTASVCGLIVLRSKNDGTLLAAVHRNVKDAQVADEVMMAVRSAPSDKLDELPAAARAFLANQAYLKADSVPAIVSFREVCSGLIEAGDVRNGSETLSFGYMPDQTRSPYDLCKLPGSDGWLENCTFEFVSVEEVTAVIRRGAYGT